MPLIIIQPRNAQEARLSMDANGVEFIEYCGVLDSRMNIRFAKAERSFPTDGVVRLRRGADFASSGDRLLDTFQYEEGVEDAEKLHPERWLVYLQMEEAAFDRFIQRLHWGLPELHLSFELSSEVVTFHPATEWEDLYFLAQPRPWERVVQATLIQIPFPAG